MSKQNLRDYWLQIEEWKKLYPIPPRSREFNLNLTQKKVGCFRCGRHRITHRHHTGSDYYFACLFPHVFAGRYIQFHPDDIEKLCRGCHRAAHQSPRFQLLYTKMFDEKLQLHDKGQVLKPKWAEEWMTKFREEFYKWCSEYKSRSLVTKSHGKRRKVKGNKRKLKLGL